MVVSIAFLIGKCPAAYGETFTATVGYFHDGETTPDGEGCDSSTDLGLNPKPQP